MKNTSLNRVEKKSSVDCTANTRKIPPRSRTEKNSPRIPLKTEPDKQNKIIEKRRESDREPFFSISDTKSDKPKASFFKKKIFKPKISTAKKSSTQIHKIEEKKADEELDPTPSFGPKSHNTISQPTLQSLKQPDTKSQEQNPTTQPEPKKKQSGVSFAKVAGLEFLTERKNLTVQRGHSLDTEANAFHLPINPQGKTNHAKKKSNFFSKENSKESYSSSSASDSDHETASPLPISPPRRDNPTSPPRYLDKPKIQIKKSSNKNLKERICSPSRSAQLTYTPLKVSPAIRKMQIQRERRNTITTTDDASPTKAPKDAL
jgi:hypothetical protein